jgi:hypothetical protein
MVMQIWRMFKEAFSENKLYFVSEIALSLFTIIFIIFLARYNNRLLEFFDIYEDPFIRAWVIFREEHFLNYFLIGVLNLLLLSLSIVFNWKDAWIESYFLFINVGVSIVLAVILLAEFWNPILTTVFLVSIAGISIVSK